MRSRCRNSGKEKRPHDFAAAVSNSFDKGKCARGGSPLFKGRNGGKRNAFNRFSVQPPHVAVRVVHAFCNLLEVERTDVVLCQNLTQSGTFHRVYGGFNFCTLRRTEVLFARCADFATREIKKTAPCASAINRQETAILKRNRIIKIPPSEFRLCVDAWYRRFCAAYQRFTNICFFAISYYKQTFAICQSNIQRFFRKTRF